MLMHYQWLKIALTWIYCLISKKGLFNLPLHLLKKWITYISFLYIVVSALIPCSFFDKCEEESYIEQTSGSDHENDCNDCSPFSACSSASGFPIDNEITSLDTLFFYTSQCYNEFHSSSKSEYYQSLFQPPRVA
jgi:hypothetical protein